MKKNILVVEDDIILQKNIKSSLESADFEVDQLFSGQGVMQKIEQKKPDLILLDLMLPKKDGFHILQDIKQSEELKNIPVIILTVINTETSVSETKMLGADDYLIKSNYSLSEIIEKINKLLKK